MFMKEPQNIGIAAAAALLLVLMVLLFITISPWMLYGVTAVLWAIAGIVRAIRGAADDGPHADPHEPVHRSHDDPSSDDTDHGDTATDEAGTNQDS